MLLVFAAVFILLFVGFAIAQGIGQPSVPSGDIAKISSVPSEIANISEADLKLAILQQVGKNKAPKPGSKKAEELKESAQVELVEAVWLRGEAEELDISVTDKQVEESLAEIKKTNFPTAASYKEFLETSHFTQEDVDQKVELQKLSEEIQTVISAGTPVPTKDEIAQSYEENKATQFTTKPTRDVRVVINKDKAEIEAALSALKEDDSTASWEKIATKYSEDPSTKTNGGLQKGLSEELLASAGPLKDAIFGAATGEVVGPLKYQGNYIVLEVEKLHAKKVQTLGEARSQISTQLQEEKQQTYFSEFVTAYRSKWIARTFCASGFETESCANYPSAKRIEKEREPYAACYEGSPKKPAKECPASVSQAKPAVPGSVTVLKPDGVPLPQRPVNAGEATSAAAGTVLPEGAAEVPTPSGE